MQSSTPLATATQSSMPPPMENKAYICLCHNSHHATEFRRTRHTRAPLPHKRSGKPLATSSRSVKTHMQPSYLSHHNHHQQVTFENKPLSSIIASCKLPSGTSQWARQLSEMDRGVDGLPDHLARVTTNKL